MIPMHIGSDHPLAAALTVLLAFGPFIVLGAVVVVMRRRDAAAEAEAEPSTADAPREE